MKYGYVASPRSIFKSVFKLRAGELLELDIRDKQLNWTVKKYWSPSQDPLDSIPDSPHEFLEMIEELLIDSVKIRMISDVPLGAFLSGGIDSSLVCALMAKVATSPIKTFSIGFHESGFDEAVFAKKVAEHLNTEHHEKYLTGTAALELIDRIPTIYSEPFADSSQLPTYLVSQFARENVTVVLSGDGGDELFSGYSRYEKVLAGWKSKKQLKRTNDHRRSERRRNRGTRIDQSSRTVVCWSAFDFPGERKRSFGVNWNDETRTIFRTTTN